MIVYLKCDGSIKKVPNVILHECFKPKVGEVVEERIDPGLWFKVLVLDSLFVDCDTRDVFWNRETLREAEYIHNFPISEIAVDHVVSFFKDRERIFEEGESYDFDPTLDELFDTASSVFNKLSLQVFDQEGNAPTYGNLLKMLHVYILPRIKFGKKDRDGVSVVLNWIEHQHGNTESFIQKKDITKRNTENSLLKQRQSFLQRENFSSSRYISTLDEHFLKLLLQHLEKDIRLSNDDLVGYDREISPLRDSGSEDDARLLGQKREKRDSVYDVLQLAMTAREEIKNVISRQHVPKKKTSKGRIDSSRPDYHLLYVEISERLQKVNNEIRDLINIKVKISSVREAVLLTLSEIDKEGESYGFNRKKGSFEIESDLFDPSNKPEEWTTLQEKVQVLLQVPKLGFRREFEKFCEKMRNKCQRLFDESKLFTISVSEPNIGTEIEPPSPRSSAFINTIGNESRKSRLPKIFPPIWKGPKKRVPQKVEPIPEIIPYSSRWSVGSISKKECEDICLEITDHISSMAIELAVEVLGSTEVHKSFHSKVYICYEEHVSAELMPILNEVYEQSYRDQCRHLSDWLSSTSLAEFGFDERKISALMKLPPGDSSTESSRETSSDLEETCMKVAYGETSVPNNDQNKANTIGNRKMKDLSLEELYKISNSQCVDIPETFAGALGMVPSNMFEQGATNNPSDSDQTFEKCLIINEPISIDVEIEKAKEAMAEGDDSDINTADKDYDMSVEIEQGTVTNIASEFEMKQESQAADSAKPNTMQQLKLDMSLANPGKQSPVNGQASVNDYDEEPPSYTEVLMRKKSTTDPPPYSTLPPLKMRFYEEFKDFNEILNEEDKACTLFSKLRQMSRALKYIESQITRLRSNTGRNVMVCADDLIDLVILLLCRMDAEMFLKLYAHMNLMIHLSPTFMQGNAHDYALVTFNVAYQHLFEQQVLQKPVDHVFH